ncbi:MAG: 1-deoxy-D-xylulose-5-phosphate synthase [Gammaproteobacteria bacterium]|jgi:1-deoxy-D-xylulose-5-phosphate synthase|nr:1-deoxy-D-xylulose-5-phosphate synthase [Gammaproteobacteria bacterium]
MTDQPHLPFLDLIDTPEDLRKLPESDLIKLAVDVRSFLLHTLNICGGHFGANMGAVDLAIALHYVFDTPRDRLIWDVGHQAYPHKILTGRKHQLTSIRQTNGLAPFLARTESLYDAFGVGHSSTSISAALGMAIAAGIQGGDRQSIAVIGDGGLTGGMAFEALNHAGAIDANLIVVLNDNEMSISKNVGALTNYLSRIMSGKTYSHFRESSKKALSALPSMKALVKRTETHLKGMITPGALFEELGFHYFGPIDGHDLKMLVPLLKNIQALKGPRLLHVITTKGKGYAPAEADPIKYHAVKPGFLTIKKEENKTQVAPPTYSDIFGQWLSDVAEKDARLMAITPAMCEGSGMVAFAKNFPKQYIDVSIAEQHSVTLAAGMACEGLKPVVAIYSTFLQRAYDQLIHDVALQNLDVTFAIDRAGLVGGDGATHNGAFDLSYLRCIPNMVVMAPSDENECRQMLHTAYQYSGPAAVRYPRGAGPGVPIIAEFSSLPIGKAEVKRMGKKVAILAFGGMLAPALVAGEALDATVINMRFVKPLDETFILRLAQTHELIVTVEENAIQGGAGSGVSECLALHRQLVSVLHLGLPDRFIEHGDINDLLADCGLDSVGIIGSIEKALATYQRAKMSNSIAVEKDKNEIEN